MRSARLLIIGSISFFLLAVLVTVVIPYIQTNNLKPYDNTHRYTDRALYGRSIYIREGCWYCHTQQVRPWSVIEKEDGTLSIEGVAADSDLGRVSDPRDYVFDKPHLLGTERTGPDLAHVAAQKSERAWHLEHHKNPSSKVPGSIMPSFDYLSDEELKALSEYLLSLK